MCYNTKHTRSVKDKEIYYRVGLYPKQEDSRAAFDIPMYHNNGFLHANQLIIPQEAPQYLIVAKWGIVPETIEPENVNEYYKGQRQWGEGLNAQSEKAFGHYFYNYNEAILHRRCIIPVDGFYESHKLPNKVSVPFHFKKKDDGPMSLAGIYSVLRGGLCTYSIFTKKATPLFKEIHNTKNRQPLMLGESETKLWLDRNTSENDLHAILRYDYNNSELDAYPISRDFNRRTVDTNYPDITNKVDYFKDTSDIKGFDLSTYKYKHLFE
ncbi:SOS response-associated peptidase [Winogradskyella sp.]|uniref:SOS response-associated peptidase n=1 Tax=Winogradskyella sp. TaxID=1883156 RepID=UPI003BAD8B72